MGGLCSPGEDEEEDMSAPAFGGASPATQMEGMVAPAALAAAAATQAAVPEETHEEEKSESPEDKPKPTEELDVLVIGGGSMGLWALREIADAGYNVGLVTDDELGKGQTLNSFGWLCGGTVPAQTSVELAKKRIKMQKDMLEFFDAHKVLYTPVQGFVSTDELWDFNTDMRSAGLVFEGARMSDEVPGMTEGRLPDVIFDREGLLKTLAQGVGHLTMCDEEIKKITQDEDGTITAVEIGSLILQPKCVVLATGAGTRALLMEMDEDDSEKELGKSTWIPTVLAVRGPKEVMPSTSRMTFGPTFLFSVPPCFRDAEDNDPNGYLLCSFKHGPPTEKDQLHTDQISSSDGTEHPSLPNCDACLKYLFQAFPKLKEHKSKLAFSAYAGHQHAEAVSVDVVPGAKNAIVACPAVFGEHLAMAKEVVKQVEAQLGGEKSSQVFGGGEAVLGRAKEAAMKYMPLVEFEKEVAGMSVSPAFGEAPSKGFLPVSKEELDGLVQDVLDAADPRPFLFGPR